MQHVNMQHVNIQHVNIQHVNMQHVNTYRSAENSREDRQRIWMEYIFFKPCNPNRLNRLISITNLMDKFFYSITICMLHYNPRHVSSINMPIFRTNCIMTASGIVTLRTVQYSLLSSGILYSGLQSDDTRCCDNIICPEDGHVNARNMSRIVM
jgi:hypothetical protein